MDIRNFFSTSYWFKEPFMAEGFSQWFFIILFLLLVAVGVALLIIRHRTAERVMQVVLGRWSALGITMGLLGLLWFSFRQQHVLLLGWRFWLLVWAAAAGWWVYKLLRYTLGRVPQIKAEQLERIRRERYMPKK